MIQTPVSNDICERTIQYWNETGEILPEVTELDPVLIKEIVDGIDDTHSDLRVALTAWAH